MKNIKAIAIVLLAALSIASTNAMATEGTKTIKTGIELKFIGNNASQPVFQLNVNNTEEDEYIVTFKDEQNNVLYTGKLKGTNITKNFQLNTEEIGDNVMSV